MEAYKRTGPRPQPGHTIRGGTRHPQKPIAMPLGGPGASAQTAPAQPHQKPETKKASMGSKEENTILYLGT